MSDVICLITPVAINPITKLLVNNHTVIKRPLLVKNFHKVNSLSLSLGNPSRSAVFVLPKRFKGYCCRCDGRLPALTGIRSRQSKRSPPSVVERPLLFSTQIEIRTEKRTQL